MKSLLRTQVPPLASFPPVFSGKGCLERIREHRAFSLVETVLALGVASFGMITLLGLIPLGLKTSRDAIDITTQSQIVQLIRNQIQLTDFSNMDQLNDRKFYYDDQGLEVDEGSPSHLFTATLVVGDMNAFNTTSMLPKEVARVVTIHLSSKTTPQSQHTFAIVAANTGF